MDVFNEKELSEVCGGDGVKIVVLEGFGDGIEGNEHLYILGIKIF